MPARKSPRKSAPLRKTETAADWESHLSTAAAERFVLRLYVAGTGPRSAQAVESINAVCREHLAGRYELEVIDIHQQPEAAIEAQIIAAPTLVKSLPEPLRRVIGDLADKEKILRGLNVVPKPPDAAP